jgi:hypothetical protein
MIGPSFSFKAVWHTDHPPDTPMTWEGLLLSGMTKASELVAGSEEEQLKFKLDLASQIESDTYKNKQRAALTIKGILQAADCYRPWLTNIFRDYMLNDYGRQLMAAVERFSDKGGAIATTNIDHVIEIGFSEGASIYPVQMRDKNEVMAWIRHPEDEDTEEATSAAAVLHLFGHVGEPDDVALDFSCDYLKADEPSISLCKNVIMSKTLLMVGFDDLSLPQLSSVAELISEINRYCSRKERCRMFHYIAVKESQITAYLQSHRLLSDRHLLPFPYGENNEDFAYLLKQLCHMKTRKRSYREAASGDELEYKERRLSVSNGVIVCVAYGMSPNTLDVQSLSLAISKMLKTSAVKVVKVSQSFSTIVTYEMLEAAAIQLWWLAVKNSSLLANEKVKAVQIESGPMLWLPEKQSDQSIGEDEYDDGLDCESVSSLSLQSFDLAPENDDVKTKQTHENFPALPSRKGVPESMKATSVAGLPLATEQKANDQSSESGGHHRVKTVEKNHHIAAEHLKHSQDERIRELCKSIKESSGVESIQYQRAKNGTIHFTVRGPDRLPERAISTIDEYLCKERDLHASQLTEANVESLESGPLELRQFACSRCNYVWWRRVLHHKPVSRCKKCTVRYDPIPYEKEYGFGTYTCNTCGRSFKSAKAQREVASLCFNCKDKGIHSPCYPESIGPFRRGNGGQSEFRPRKGHNPHACSRCEFGRVVPCPLFSIVVEASNRHISTGSTVSTFLTQMSQMSVDGDLQ